MIEIIVSIFVLVIAIYFGIKSSHKNEQKPEKDSEKPDEPKAPAIGDKAPASKLPTLTRVLMKGMKGDDVKALQTYLISLGYNLGSYGADGDFGDITTRAVKNYQTIHELPITGIVDAKLWDYMGGTMVVEQPSSVGARLGHFAEMEAAKELTWSGPNSEAEKYLHIFRQEMFEKGQIGRDKVFYNWCAAWVTYCCQQIGYQIPLTPTIRGQKFWATMALVNSWRAWGKENGFYFKRGTATPKRGDIILFDWDSVPADLEHIGIVRGYDGGSTIQTSEGNRNNRSGNYTRYMSSIEGFLRLK